MLGLGSFMTYCAKGNEIDPKLLIRAEANNINSRLLIDPMHLFLPSEEPPNSFFGCNSWPFGSIGPVGADSWWPERDIRGCILPNNSVM
jgi:hypothetical protein